MSASDAQSGVVPARALVVRAGTGPHHALRNGRGRSETLAGPAVGARYVVAHRVTINPGSQPGPYHLHRHADNTYVALEGELEVVAEGKVERLGPGDAIFIPAGHPHATHNPSGQPAVLLAIYDRPTTDDFEVVDRPAGES